MLDPETLPHLLTAKQVSALLNVSLSSVYSLGIPTVKLSPRRYRWKRDDVLALMNATYGSQPAPTAIATAEWALPASHPRDWRTKMKR